MIIRIVKCFLILAVLLIIRASAQTATRSEQCFDVRVRLNGKQLEGPREVTLSSREIQKTFSRSQGCFSVPPELLQQDKLELTFNVGKSRLDMPNIPTFRLDTLLDVELEDKRFSAQSAYTIPKNARIRNVCFVAFQEGEPGITTTFTQCRQPIK